MFNGKYFKHLLRTNWKLQAVLASVMVGLIVVIISVFDPETMKIISENSANMPFNPLGDVSSLISLLGNQYFGMLAIILSMILVIILATKMIAGLVDRGSMACHLSVPITRTQISCTSAMYIIVSLVVMFGLVAGVGISVAELIQPGELEIGTFLFLTLGIFLLQYAIGGIAFFASCIWNTTSRALIVGAGVPVAFFSFNLISGMSDSLEFLRNFTLMTLFDIDGVIAGVDFGVKFLLLALIGTALYAVGIGVFKRKDLVV